MANGGNRPGAGRKAGSANKLVREAKERAVKGGILPLDHMLKVMRTRIPGKLKPAERARREARQDDAAKAAAPYIHPKLQNVEMTGAGGGPVKTEQVGESVNTTELARQIAFALRKGVETKKKI